MKEIPPMEYVSFNVNENVRVRLTNYGVEVYNAYHLKLAVTINSYYGNSKYFPPALEVDQDGYSYFQLHELMKVFGPTLQIGPISFKNLDIELPQSLLKPK